MKRPYLLFILLCCQCSFVANAQYYDGRVRVDSADRSILFQVTEAHPQLHSRHFYTWFKSGHIYTTEGSFYGKLLHGDYKVVDKERHLLEEGRFRMGERKGLWRTWYENGFLKTRTQKRFWDGALAIKEYSAAGSLTKRGFEKDGRFTGWQTEPVKDSILVVHYKKGMRQPTQSSKK
ncbi:MAG: hypothetical protein J7539_17940 [Niabella sp.]|nr:hypothetical protein [Niabella sp.]